MPYNTRRKSLSLPSLGIHVPVTHAARAAANRASPSHPTYNKSHGASSSTSSIPSPLAYSQSASSSSSTTSMDAQTHNKKKIKRSHSSNDGGASHMPATKRHQTDANTPPPSPRLRRANSVEMKDADDTVASITKIDLDAINDEIVEAVIVQLQGTANRPHLVKELAAILMQQLRIVQQSANPCAIISSRLSTYLKRSCWSASTPCPLAKELETVHPRRTYFYLTTCPHQPLPDPAMAQLAVLQQRAIITPSLTSASSASEDADEERRRELSPSPEVDLSSPEFDDMDDDLPMPSTPIGSFSGRHTSTISIASRNHRGASPPLEKDEKEFTQTADVLQKRKLSGDMMNVQSSPVDHNMSLEEASKDDNLFGESKAGTSMAYITSPAMRPSFGLPMKKDTEMDSWAKLDNLLEWDRSPENIELEELDYLLNDY